MTTRQQLRLGRADDGVKVTREEFAEAEFDEPWRYERVNGRLVVMAPSGPEHINAGEPIRDCFVAYKLAHPDRVANVVNEAWIRVPQSTDRIADLAIYLKPSRSRLQIPDLPPDIVVEITSPGYANLRRDDEEKRADYFRAGVKEYLVVDRFDHRVTLFRRNRGRFVEQVLEADGTYTTPLMPGLKLPLAGII